MKRVQRLFLVITTLATAFLGSLRAETALPGQVDFGTFAAPKSGDFAEINITSSLISLLSNFVEQKDAELSQLLKGLQQVRVNVVGLTEENRADLEKRAAKVGEQLDKSGWERVVRAQQKGKNVRVY